MAERWFRIDGEPEGERTLAEQMKGLGGALDGCCGKTVVDFGCAEGLIAQQFAQAGAKSVFGIEYNPALFAVAQRLERAHAETGWHNLHFQLADIRTVMKQERESGEIWRYDIVLALAVIHKLPDPADAATFMADVTGELLVVRLPKGSSGAFKGKNWPWAGCDLNTILPSRGLKLDTVAKGPRGEQVQYWRRAPR